VTFLSLILCTLLLSAALRTKFRLPWIWILPNAAAFSLGLVFSVDWLSASSQTSAGSIFFEQGLLPVILWVGPAASLWIIRKTKNLLLSFIPLFISLLSILFLYQGALTL
jgi:hypothetical protein